MGLGQASDPLCSRGERHSVPSLTRPDRKADREVGLPGAGRAQEDDVLARGDEIQGPQMCDHLAAQPAGVIEVELFERLAGGEPSCPDPAFAAVGFPGGDLTSQAGREELLMTPGLRSSPFGQSRHGFAKRGGLEGPSQERELTTVRQVAHTRPPQ